MVLRNEPHGSFGNPLTCGSAAEWAGYPADGEHCGTCHWSEFFEDEACHPVVLADGRHAEVCCPVKEWLAERDLIPREDR